MVFLGDDDTVNFVKLEDIFITPFGLSKIPIVSKEIIYDLEEPNKSVIKYSNNKEYLLDDEFGLLSEGIVIKTIQLKNEYGAPFYYPVYYGVCINEKEIGEIEKYYIDDNRHIYVFMCEDYNDNMRKMYNKSFWKSLIAWTRAEDLNIFFGMFTESHSLYATFQYRDSLNAIHLYKGMI